MVGERLDYFDYCGVDVSERLQGNTVGVGFLYFVLGRDIYIYIQRLDIFMYRYMYIYRDIKIRLYIYIGIYRYRYKYYIYGYAYIYMFSSFSLVRLVGSNRFSFQSFQFWVQFLVVCFCFVRVYLGCVWSLSFFQYWFFYFF